MLAERAKTIIDAVEVLAISTTEWRIRDNDRPQSDATSLLGFICRVGDLYEVVEIGKPMNRSYFATFGAALSALRSHR
jgi:hypothetical protein